MSTWDGSGICFGRKLVANYLSAAKIFNGSGLMEGCFRPTSVNVSNEETMPSRSQQKGSADVMNMQPYRIRYWHPQTNRIEFSSTICAITWMHAIAESTRHHTWIQEGYIPVEVEVEKITWTSLVKDMPLVRDMP